VITTKKEEYVLNQFCSLPSIADGELVILVHC